MGNPKGGISQTRLIAERNGRQLGTRGTTVHMCWVLDAQFLEFGLGSFGAQFVAKFPIP